MNSENLIKELERYHLELNQIMGRFNKSSSGLHIRREDYQQYCSFVIEIVDLLNDSLGENHYSKLINQKFNEGISNYLQSPSYKSIEEIISIIISVETRLKRNSSIIHGNNDLKQRTIEQVTYPEKVTLKWLLAHVPASYWWSCILILAFVFGLGVKFGNTNLYKSLTTSVGEVRK